LIEFLNETVLWWHWIIFGIILLIVDMTLATFFILGLGAAAVIVGVVDLLVMTTFTQELSIWMVLAILIIAGWFKWFRQKPLTQSGQSNYRLDTLGTITQAIEPHSRGKVTFDTPVLGNTTWHATSKVALEVNTRVQIVQINGQLIEVEPLHTTA
jgi:membrane protein implicated in regulation of membrane protease activity